MAILINDNYSLQGIKPFDDRYLNISTPWASVGAANAGIPTYRYTGLTVNVLGVEYWWKNGVDDVDLVQKESSIVSEGITGATNGLTKVGQDVKLGGTTPLNEITNICGATNALNLGTAASKLGAFQINAASVAILATGTTEICPIGALTLDGSAISVKEVASYDSNKSPFTARQIPDAEWVTGCTSTAGIQTVNNGLTKVGTNAVLGGALTGNTSLTGTYDLSFSHTNINLTGSTAINLCGEVRLKSTPATYVGDILTYDSSDGAISKTTLSSLGGLTGATNGIGTTGQDVCLGGVLVANTAITGDFDLCLGTNASCLNTLQIYTEENIIVETDNNLTMSLSGGTIITSNLKGLCYGADYIDTFVNNSLVSKLYVDTVASGLDPKSAVLVATTVNITLNDLQTIDSVSLVEGDRVLVKNQTSGETNGIYDVVSGASWTRSNDFDGTTVGEVTEGALIPVLSGDTQINSSWILITKDPITVGTTPLVFTKFSQLLDVNAGAGIAISTVGETKTICVNLGSNSGLNTSSGLVVDSSIAGNALSLASGILNVNAASCGVTDAIPVGYNSTDCLVVACVDLISALGTPINSANNGLTKVGSNVVLGGALTGDTTISGAHTLALSSLTAFNATATDIGLTGAVGVIGAIDGSSTLDILGATTLHSTLDVTGATTITSLNASGAIDAESTLDILGATTLHSTLDVTGVTSLSAVASYLSDLSPFTARQIPDAAWVTGCTSTAGVQTVNNGLTKVGTNAVLGGALTGDTAISGAYTLSICDGAELNTTCGYQISGVTMLRTSTSEISSIYLGGAGSNGSGTDNIGIGCGALSANTTGEGNIAQGIYALCSNTSGRYNVAQGFYALCANTEGRDNLAIGSYALAYNIDGCRNLAQGYAALCENTSGDYNIAQGMNALLHNTTGCDNIAMGYRAGYENTTGCNNVVQGRCAFYSNVTGSTNVVIGYQAGYSETGSNKLHIANSQSCSLISGDFAAKTVTLDAKLTLSQTPTAGTTSDAVLVRNSGGEVRTVAGTELGEDNNIYNKTIVSANATGTTASTYVQLISGATTFTLPASPQDGQAFKIKDACGNALAAPITIDASSGLTIDGSQCALINTDYGALELVYGATNEWFSLAYIN